MSNLPLPRVRLRWPPWPTAALVLLAGCASVAWQQGPPETWRGASARGAEHAVVAARDDGAAAEAYERWEEVLGALRRQGIPLDARPLLIAVDEDEPPLLGDALATLERLVSWHRQLAFGEVDAGRQPRATRELPGDVLRALACAAGGAVPLAADELALPAAWREQVAWCLLVPLQATCDRAADLALDHGLAEKQKEMSFGDRLLMTTMMPFVRGYARDELRGQVLRRIVEAALATARREGAVPDDALERCVRELGLDVRPTAPAGGEPR